MPEELPPAEADVFSGQVQTRTTGTMAPFHAQAILGKASEKRAFCRGAVRKPLQQNQSKLWNSEKKVRPK
jgi:hypothetical protein